MNIKRPTANQARLIAKALNESRIRRGNLNCPKFWAVVDGDCLFIGSGDNGQTKPRATSWGQAQALLCEAREGKITA